MPQLLTSRKAPALIQQAAAAELLRYWPPSLEPPVFGLDVSMTFVPGLLEASDSEADVPDAHRGLGDELHETPLPLDDQPLVLFVEPGQDPLAHVELPVVPSQNGSHRLQVVTVHDAIYHVVLEALPFAPTSDCYEYFPYPLEHASPRKAKMLSPKGIAAYLFQELAQETGIIPPARIRILRFYQRVFYQVLHASGRAHDLLNWTTLPFLAHPPWTASADEAMQHSARNADLARIQAEWEMDLLREGSARARALVTEQRMRKVKRSYLSSARTALPFWEHLDSLVYPAHQQRRESQRRERSPRRGSHSLAKRNEVVARYFPVPRRLAL
ncbi:uncharacterized protein JCM10292_002173 [Rhodotorula paludigena]|uniref:uncharacterized protein n=1 Tax=Rhodotorula paludigena TaxID=86838 RepID=UPI00317282E3